MSKRKLAAIFSAVLMLAVAVFAYIEALQSNGALENSKESVSLSDTTGQYPESLGSRQQGKMLDTSRAVSRTMNPDRAYADAVAIMKCTHAADNIVLPDDMTTEQEKEFESSRVAGLDCLVLGGTYSAYELVRYAAENDNLEAQLHFPALAAHIFNDEENALNPKLIADFKSDFMKFLNRAASSGNSEAYASLAENYRSGMFSDKDKINAYAYAFASSQLRPSPISIRWANQFANGLTANEVARAQQMGLKLVNSQKAP